MTMMLLLGVVWSVPGPSANAQGLDGIVPSLPPGPPGPGASVVAEPWGSPEGSWHAGGRFGAAAAPLVRETTDDGRTLTESVLGTLAGFDLVGSWAPVDRLAVGLVAPFRAPLGGVDDAGPGLGDVQISSSLNLADGVAGVALQPLLTLPTGPSARYLGDGGLGGELHVAGGARTSAVQGAARAGVRYDASVAQGPPGGAALQAGAAVGPRWDGLAILAEAIGTVPLQDGIAGAELYLTARAVPHDRLLVTAAVGRGLTDTPGVPSFRAHLGVGFRSAPEQEARRDHTRDPRQIELRVLDPEGRPVRDAIARIGDRELGRSDHEGRLTLDTRVLNRGRGTVEARSFQPTELTGTSIESGQVELEWVPTEVRLRVTNQEGRLVDANVSLEGPRDEPRPVADAVGTLSWMLSPGTWRLSATAQDHVVQRRTLDVLPGTEGPLEVDIVLSEWAGDGRLELQVADRQGEPVDGVLVRVGDVVLGTTGTGGDVTVEGLSPGAQELRIEHPAYDQGPPTTVRLDAASDPQELRLDHIPGSVELRVRGPDGHPADALVYLRGPMVLSPFRLGLDGRHDFVLGDGVWTLLVTSATLGMQERVFTVDETSPNLQRIEIELLPAPPSASSELLMVVTDGDGRPVSGASISIDGRPVGKSSSAGRLKVGDLLPLPLDLEVTAPQMTPWRREIALAQGPTEVSALLDWEAGSVRVRVVDAVRRPVQADVRARGPASEVQIALDPTGETLTRLAPGTWDLLATSKHHGLQAVRVDIPDAPVLSEVRFLLGRAAGARTLEVAVNDPDGEPIDGALLSLAGRPLGRTASGGILRTEQLATTSGTLTVQADGFVTVEQELRGRAATAQVAMAWADGLVDFSIEGPDGPVDGATLHLAGPWELTPMAARGGRARAVLAPGDWTVVVASASLGLHQEDLHIAEGSSRIEHTVHMPKPASGLLLVRVRDEVHVPVAGAGVEVAGITGTTSAGGSTLLDGVPPGPAVLRVVPPVPFAAVEQAIDLTDGSSERLVVLQWPRTATTLGVEDASGNPVDGASVQLEGRLVLPVATTSQGVVQLDLVPGRWQVTASDGRYRAIADLDIEPGARSAELTLTLDTEAFAIGEQRSVRLEESVLFDSGEASLRPEADSLLGSMASRLRADRSVVLAEVQGHTDDVGGMAYNLDLSIRRAQTVMEALVSRGVRAERLRARGYAMLRPADNQTTEQARQLNRRVEVHIIQRAE